MFRRSSALAAVALGVVLAGITSHGVAATKQGATIAFESNRTGTSHIYVTTDGKTADLTPKDKANDSAPSWSPDGRSLAFTSDRRGRYAIWVMNADGTEARQLTKSAGLDVNPVWSPQGDRIAFTSNAGGQWDVALTSPSGGRQQLTKDKANEIDVTWAPNGTAVVYDRLEKGTSDLWAQSVKGGAPKQLTATPTIAELNPAWQPQGNLIAYDAHNASGQYDIYVLDVRTGKSQQVTNDAADDSDPSWTADGKQILFTREAKGGDYEVYAVNVDGSGLVDISRDPAGLDFAASARQAPLGFADTRSLESLTTGTPPVFKCASGYTGNDFDNRIPGDDAQNFMCGLGGNDTIIGGKGDDYINGGNGSDHLYGGDGNDWIKTRPETPSVRDWVYGEAGSNNAWIGSEDWADRNTYCRL